MKLIITSVLASLGVGAVAACSGGDTAIDAVAYKNEILEWRAGRLERLKGPTGFLNLAGLYWLPDGRSTFGSDVDNDIVFPAQAAPRIGSLQVSDEGVTLVVEAGVEVRHDGMPVQTMLMSDDTTESPVSLSHKSFAWVIIKRDNRFALRLRDYENPAIDAFPPIEYYPIRSDLRVPATLRKFAEPRIMNVDTVIEGLGWRPQSPGVVEFELGGQTFELQAYDSGDELFFVFGDETSGRETYPAGRFLYADFPADGGTTILDFNKAYNPPCAFNEFATCPVASPQNRMRASVEAGEKFDPGVHYAPDVSH